MPTVGPTLRHRRDAGAAAASDAAWATAGADPRAAELGERLIVRSVEDSIASGRVALKSPDESRNVHQSVTLLDAIAGELLGDDVEEAFPQGVVDGRHRAGEGDGGIEVGLDEITLAPSRAPRRVGPDTCGGRGRGWVHDLW